MNALFTEQHSISLGKTAVADTTAETLTAVSDMADYDEITWIVKFGDVDAAAVLTLAPKENTASSTSSPTPTAVSLVSASLPVSTVTPVLTTGAAVVTESSGNLDNKTVIINVKKSAMSKRYVFLSITATDESYEIVSIDTIKSSSKQLPVSHGSEVVSVVTYAA
jgi:hypothetical protein